MIRKISWLLLLLATCTLSVQGQSANDILDQAAAVIRQSTGAEARFSITVKDQEAPAGNSQGTIQFKGHCFRLETPEIITWFDGKTQWSYLKNSEEVNISSPTPEEIQQLNPYSLLTLHRQGYQAVLGEISYFQKNSIYEITLSSDKGNNMQQIVVYLKKNSLTPVFIRVVQNDGIVNEVNVQSFQLNRNWNEDHFTFQSKDYPDAEVIDLR